ncbi:KEOPS complex N(6)-L-threonylcarbamoyladenine synthase Kae1 [Infirmifilum sp. NZ]|uniref:KEOPS complex N(6)-L-threonylcarbamoyladenine synthase Kae1 n=1 Tax=Infirmifilum sp. NZ TaxID=2926850 RepID=UPI0027A0AFBB|nr:KEOPS complex N(6)-L-threonylcarbamoyladenine synthase Kae1 [Infirmifilum sp. NZ]UNQ72619.1 N(6)-L-threonylcarbamoyladenine synthase Kae1 [Infirmifilum sp. NZ]
MVLVLGIESTAHTFGVGIASENGDILANVNRTYVPPSGGIKPSDAAEHHSKVAVDVLRRALAEAGLSLRDLDAVAVALGPGMGPCLRVGATLARYLALKLAKPLVPVNHAVAHVEIALLSTGTRDPVVVYVAGGNTIITAFNEGRYRVFGETLDIPLGNCLDAFAREVGLGFPGVPRVEELAKRGSKYIEMPYVVKGQDLSYSGLLTYAIKLYKEKRYPLEDVCFSLVETAYSMLVEVTERALAHTGKKEVVLTGGVARSELLSKKLSSMAESRGVRFARVLGELAGDNGAMIAYTGALAYASGVTIDVDESRIRPLWRLDEVEIPWRK